MSAKKKDAVKEPAGEKRRPLTDEERAALYKQQLKELRVLDLAHDMMLSLVTVGYQKLGLTEETRELRNLDDARLAIEALRGVIGAVAKVAGEGEVETYRATLAAMQMNYARVATAEDAEPAGPPEPAAEAGSGEADESAAEAAHAGSAEAGEPAAGPVTADEAEAATGGD
jgi:hypothetical protein